MNKAPPPPRPSVLIVIDTRIVGGPGRGLFYFLDCADHSKFYYQLCAFKYSKPGSEEFIDEARKRGYNLSIVHQSSRFDPRPLWLIWCLISKGKHNILQTHGYKGHVVAAALRLIRRIPWIAFSHGWTAENKKVGWYHDIGRRCMMSAEAIVAVSEPLAEEIRQSTPSLRPITIPNAIDLGGLPELSGGDSVKSELGYPMNSVLIGCFGRLSTEKGQTLLLRSIAKITNQNICILFAGDGPDREKLEALSIDLGLNSRVRFVGHQTNLTRYYDAIDALVIPSLNEGLPNVLLEAMAYKKVVIATPVGAIPSILENGVSGFLASTADVPSLTNSIEAYLANGEMNKKIVANARKIIEDRFSAHARAARVVDLYDSVLAGVPLLS